MRRDFIPPEASQEWSGQEVASWRGHGVAGGFSPPESVPSSP